MHEQMWKVKAGGLAGLQVGSVFDLRSHCCCCCVVTRKLCFLHMVHASHVCVRALASPPQARPHPRMHAVQYGQRSIQLSYSSSPHRHKFAYDRQDLGLEALAVPLPLKIELYGVVLVLWFVILEVKVQRPWHLE